MRLIVILCLICLISAASLNRKKKQHIIKNEELYAVDSNIDSECRAFVLDTFQLNEETFQEGEEQCLGGLHLPQYETSQQQLLDSTKSCLTQFLLPDHATEFQALYSHTECVLDHMVFKYVPSEEFDPEGIPMAEGYEQPDYPEPKF